MHSDTDGDGLPDGYEVYTLGTDPTKADTDNNGTNDVAEDADNDGLTNLNEYQLGTNPTNADSDNDGLKDGEEVNTYHTDPLKKDTDGDTLSDGDEIHLEINPLKYDTDDNGISDADEKFQVTIDKGQFSYDPNAIPTLNIELQGKQIDSLSVKPITDNDLLGEKIPGYIGCGYSFTVDGDFDNSILTFEFDSELLKDPDFVPRIYYYDEDEQLLSELENQVVSGNTVSSSIEHFSTYIVLNKTEYDNAWENVKNFFNEAITVDESINVVLVIDTTINMKYDDPDDNRKLLARKFVDKLSDNDNCAICPMEYTLTHYGFTSDKAKLYSQIEKINNEEVYIDLYNGIKGAHNFLIDE